MPRFSHYNYGRTSFYNPFARGSANANLNSAFYNNTLPFNEDYSATRTFEVSSSRPDEKIVMNSQAVSVLSAFARMREEELQEIDADSAEKNSNINQNQDKS